MVGWVRSLPIGPYQSSGILQSPSLGVLVDLMHVVVWADIAAIGIAVFSGEE